MTRPASFGPSSSMERGRKPRKKEREHERVISDSFVLVGPYYVQPDVRNSYNFVVSHVTLTAAETLTAFFSECRLAAQHVESIIYVLLLCEIPLQTYETNAISVQMEVKIYTQKMEGWCKARWCASNLCSRLGYFQ